MIPISSDSDDFDVFCANCGDDKYSLHLFDMLYLVINRLIMLCMMCNVLLNNVIKY